jgi:sterol desaturase/sphingolipid hydroxylase (fatty acid hydroxylase superfamily)
MPDVNTILNHPLFVSFADSGKWFLICMALFIPLAWLFPGKSSQPLFRRDMISDSLYWFIGPILYLPIYVYIVTLLLNNLYSTHSANLLIQSGLPPINHLPIWFQACLMLLATDFLQYWMHRLFHNSGLWKFHAIHHSSEHVDWLSSARFHPVNIILYSTSMNAIVFMLGFSPTAFGELFLFNVIYSPLVHANLNWNYGPFRYILASPVFHRWHHTMPEEGGNKNFAPTFPFIDLMFGTFYMPKGVQPTNFGAPHDNISGNLFNQLAYPFRKQIKKSAAPETITPLALE